VRVLLARSLFYVSSPAQITMRVAAPPQRASVYAKELRRPPWRCACSMQCLRTECVRRAAYGTIRSADLPVVLHTSATVSA